MKKLFFIFLLTHTVFAFSENSYPKLYKLFFKICTIAEKEVTQEAERLGKELRSEIARELEAKPRANYIIFSMAAAAFPERVDEYVKKATCIMPTGIEEEIQSLGPIIESLDRIDVTKDSFSKVEMHIIENYFRLVLAEETLEKYKALQAKQLNNPRKRKLWQKK